MPWQRMRASHLIPAWVSCCKCSTCSCRSPDISCQTQIPLTIAYCPESSIYRRWHSEQGSVSPLRKEIRASHTLSKVLGGVICQPSESVGHPPSPAPSDHFAGSGGSPGSRRQSRSHAQSITPAHSWQSGSVDQQLAIIPFVPMLLKMVRCRAASPNPSKMREMALRKMTTPKKTRAGSRPQVMGRWCQMVRSGRSALIPKTPSPALVRSLVNMRTQTQSQTLERKSSPSSEIGTQKALGRSAP